MKETWFGQKDVCGNDMKVVAVESELSSGFCVPVTLRYLHIHTMIK